MRIRIIAVVAVLSAATVGWAGPASADTIAQDDPPVVVAQDSTPAPGTVPARVVGIDADIIDGLSVTGHAGKPVTARAKGHPTRTAAGVGNKPAVLRNLTPGVRYTISIDGRVIGKATPLGQVGPTSGLRVETTDTPGSVQVSWAHTVLAGEGRSVTYAVTATPLTADGPGTPIVTANVSGLSTTLNGLDTTRLYRFVVVAQNSASSGRSTSATMTHVLGGGPPANVPAPPPTPTPAPQPAPAPAPAPPATQTIYVCPGGFTDTGTACQKVLAYTYHDQMVTASYTYHSETQSTGPCSYLPNPNSPTGLDIYCPQTTVQVKDAPPSEWTDNGSAYTRTLSVKDATPLGYSDNGTQWVSTVAKVPQVVPA